MVTIRGAPCGTRPPNNAPNPRSAGFAPSPSLRASRLGLYRSVANSRCVPGCDLVLPSGDRQWGGQRTESTNIPASVEGDEPGTPNRGDKEILFAGEEAAFALGLCRSSWLQPVGGY